MKNLLKASLIFVAISLSASSCTTSKKQHCDAYGNGSYAQENVSSDIILEANDVIKEEKVG